MGSSGPSDAVGQPDPAAHPQGTTLRSTGRPLAQLSQVTVGGNLTIGGVLEARAAAVVLPVTARPDTDDTGSGFIGRGEELDRLLTLLNPAPKTSAGISRRSRRGCRGFFSLRNQAIGSEMWRGSPRRARRGGVGRYRVGESIRVLLSDSVSVSVSVAVATEML